MILPSPYWNKKRVLKGSKSAQNWPKYRCLRPPKKDQRRKLLLEVAAVWFVFERNASIFASETVFLHLPQIFHVSAAIIFNNSSWQQINSQLYLRGGWNSADGDDKIMKTINQIKRQIQCWIFFPLKQIATPRMCFIFEEEKLQISWCENIQKNMGANETESECL